MFTGIYQCCSIPAQVDITRAVAPEALADYAIAALNQLVLSDKYVDLEVR